MISDRSLASGQSGSTVTIDSNKNNGTSQYNSGEKFDPRDYLHNLTLVEGKGKQSPSQGEYHCPICNAENFKIDLEAGKYYTWGCACNLGDAKTKQAFIMAIKRETTGSTRYTGVTSVHKKKPSSATEKETGTPHPTIDKVPNKAGTVFYPYYQWDLKKLQRRNIADPLSASVSPHKWEIEPLVKVRRTDYDDGTPKKIRMEPSGAVINNALPYGIEEMCWNMDADERANLTLFIVEGERTAETLNRHIRKKGINALATTAIGGTGNGWKELHTEVICKLGFQRVVLCPDGDISGVDHMVDVYKQFEAKEVNCGWLLSDKRPYSELEKGGGIDMADIIDGGQLPDDHDLLDAIASPEKIEWLNRLLSLTVEDEDVASDEDEDAILAKWLPSSIDAWFSKPTKGNWLIEGLVASGSTMVASASNLGKSILVTQIAMAIITGEDILGCNVNRQGKVIYHASDEGEDILKGRLAKQGLLSSPHRNDFIPLICDTDGVYWDLSMLPVLEQIFRRQEPVAYIMDSLSSAINPLGITELDAKVLQYINQLRKLCEQYSVALIMIHHTRKNATGGLNDVSGSGSIVRPFDVVHVMTEDRRNGGQARKLTLEKSRTSQRGTKKHLLLDGETLTFTVNHDLNDEDDEDESDRSSERKVSAKDKILNYLESHADSWVSLDDLAEATGIAKASTTTTVNRLKRDGLVEADHGSYRWIG